MRRVLALAVAAAAFFATTACDGAPAQPQALAPSGSASASAEPTATVAPSLSPGDAAVTRQVCTEVTTAAADASKVFTDQIAAIEAAAAKGDQTAMVAAATAIQQKLLTLAKSLTMLAGRPVDSDVRTALTDGASALKEISSESYTGTTQDTQKRLGELAASFGKACG